MAKFPIRNDNNKRVFDICIEGEEMVLEVKTNRGIETIDFNEMMSQIEKEKQKSATEL